MINQQPLPIRSDYSPFYPIAYPKIIVLDAEVYGDWRENTTYYNTFSGTAKRVEFSMSWSYHDGSESDISCRTIDDMRKLRISDENTRKMFLDIQWYREFSVRFANTILNEHMSLTYSSSYQITRLIGMSDSCAVYSVHFEIDHTDYILTIKKVNRIIDTSGYPKSSNYLVSRVNYFMLPDIGTIQAELMLAI